MYSREDGEPKGNYPFSADSLVDGISLCFFFLTWREKKWVFRAIVECEKKDTRDTWWVNSFFFFFLFTATPATYGSSWARGQIQVSATGLCHSHSNVVPDPSHICDLCCSLWQHQILNSLSEARGWTCILTETVLCFSSFGQRKIVELTKNIDLMFYLLCINFTRQIWFRWFPRKKSLLKYCY